MKEICRQLFGSGADTYRYHYYFEYGECHSSQSLELYLWACANLRRHKLYYKFKKEYVRIFPYSFGAVYNFKKGAELGFQPAVYHSNNTNYCRNKLFNKCVVVWKSQGVGECLCGFFRKRGQYSSSRLSGQ